MDCIDQRDVRASWRMAQPEQYASPFCFSQICEKRTSSIRFPNPFHSFMTWNGLIWAVRMIWMLERWETENKLKSLPFSLGDLTKLSKLWLNGMRTHAHRYLEGILNLETIIWLALANRLEIWRILACSISLVRIAFSHRSTITGNHIEVVDNSICTLVLLSSLDLSGLCSFSLSFYLMLQTIKYQRSLTRLAT